jgi:ATPase subunit of ABC transporter with duplicated ATPase domains
MIMGELQPDSGRILLNNNLRIAIARQVIPREQMIISVREYFSLAFIEKDYSLDRKIAKVLADVNLPLTDYDKIVKDLSG